jgi:hypothetical protein
MRPCPSVVVLTLFAASATAADPAADAKAVLDKAIEAHGGAAKLAAVKGESWKAKGKMLLAEPALVYTADYLFAAPDKLRFDMRAEAGGQKITLTAATDGKLAWEQSGPLLRDMAKDKQAEFHHNVYTMTVCQLVPLRDPAYKLTPLGESQLDGRKLIGLKVSHPGRRDLSLYFDAATGLLAKTTTRVVDEFQNKEVTQDAFLTGYRDRDGRQVFDKLTIKRDGKDFVVEELSDQKVLDAVDAKAFAKPAAK